MSGCWQRRRVYPGREAFLSGPEYELNGFFFLRKNYSLLRKKISFPASLSHSGSKYSKQKKHSERQAQQSDVSSRSSSGFGDSTGDPSEAGLTADALYLYHWAKAQSKGSPVYLWGHSLGSGVATNTAVKIQEQGSAVDAVILEAPYTRIGDVIADNLLVKMYTLLPGVESLLWNLLEKINISFANDENLKTLSSPLLILHAEDDNIVPYRMGQKLYQIALQARKESNSDARVQMITYRGNLGLSHSHICLDPDLSDVVQTFLQT
ncbi:PREDICTED: abhydrolase domain-containing protein 12B [Cyprinodon variegatus]|uniref:abhydrolase domain-containing protein 12B n=1 Tax=Cyprinodon variegatus TaxID=28743 RepID=UPI0007429C5A|nr:PREDICTED: abhydrolase domain-containing protein 12B [Cyprinodon variegatus]